VDEIDETNGIVFSGFEDDSSGTVAKYYAGGAIGV